MIFLSILLLLIVDPYTYLLEKKLNVDEHHLIKNSAIVILECDNHDRDIWIVFMKEQKWEFFPFKSCCFIYSICFSIYGIYTLDTSSTTK